MKIELKPHHRDISDEELLDDLKRVALLLNKESFSSREYLKHGGRFSISTISIRFKKWNNALEKAGLSVLMQISISEKELFKNMEEVWVKLGEKPIYRKMRRPLSKYNAAPYRDKYGTRRKALEAFVEYMNKEPDETPIMEEAETTNVESIKEKEIVFKHKTKRTPSSTLNEKVLMRDGNKCRLCGITLTGENIHFDHMKPLSKGGETTLENLQILCAEHNLAKGNMELLIKTEVTLNTK
jgi:hypothetical protein